MNRATRRSFAGYYSFPFGGSFEVFKGFDRRWYWWACFPGCLPDGDPVGPFDTAREAYDDALSNAEDDDDLAEKFGGQS